jgi:hypothetical protein
MGARPLDGVEAPYGETSKWQSGEASKRQTARSTGRVSEPLCFSSERKSTLAQVRLSFDWSRAYFQGLLATFERHHPYGYTTPSCWVR